MPFQIYMMYIHEQMPFKLPPAAAIANCFIMPCFVDANHAVVNVITRHSRSQFAIYFHQAPTIWV